MNQRMIWNGRYKALTEKERYKKYAEEGDKFFSNGLETLENGYIKDSNLDWNVKCRNKIREHRKNGWEWERIHKLVKKHVSLETLKSQLYVNGIAELTARQVYYQLKK